MAWIFRLPSPASIVDKQVSDASKCASHGMLTHATPGLHVCTRHIYEWWTSRLSIITSCTLNCYNKHHTQCVERYTNFMIQHRKNMHVKLSDHLQYSSCGGVQLHTNIVCCSYRYSCVLKIRAQTSLHESICTCRTCTWLSNILYMHIRSHISKGLYVDEPVNLDTWINGVCVYQSYIHSQGRSLWYVYESKFQRIFS